MSAEIISALERAPLHTTHWIVVLWTWLEPQIGQLNSRETKLRSIRNDIIGAELADRVDLAATLEELRSSRDLLGDAAKALVRLERFVAGNGRPETMFVGPMPGIDGCDHLVVAWQPWLVKACWWNDPRRSGDTPPTADYPPSMAELAPSLIVIPAEVGGRGLVDVVGDDVDAARAVERARQRLGAIAHEGAGAPESPPRFVIHLGTLGDNSLDGLVTHKRRGVFSYCDPKVRTVQAAIDAELSHAVAEAVGAAADVLLLPELAVPLVSVPRLKALLRDADRAPALTVAGLRHDDVVSRNREPEMIGGALASRLANEALVLGDDGSEIFRHRKMTSFSMPRDQVDYEEDTRLGTELQVLRTAIGNVAVVTCLDAFAGTVERLKKSHASLVLVPSLSPTVGPHQAALVDAVRVMWGSAFVCNRHPQEMGDSAWLAGTVRSFWTIAMLNVPRKAARIPGDVPSLVFDLAQEFADSQQGSSMVAGHADDES